MKANLLEGPRCTAYSTASSPSGVDHVPGTSRHSPTPSVRASPGSSASPNDRVQLLVQEIEDLAPNVASVVLERAAGRLQQLARAAASREGEAGAALAPVAQHLSFRGKSEPRVVVVVPLQTWNGSAWITAIFPVPRFVGVVEYVRRVVASSQTPTVAHNPTQTVQATGRVGT